MPPRKGSRRPPDDRTRDLSAKHAQNRRAGALRGRVGSNPTPGANAQTYALRQLVFDHGLYLLKEGYRESTIERRLRLLKKLGGNSDLNDPESVKVAITRMNWSEGTKEVACETYATYAKSHGVNFEKPRYHRIEKLPFIPLEEEIDALISGTGAQTSCVLQLLKETGARIGEIWRLKWIDVDTLHGIVTISPEKGSNPRQFKITPRLCAMLNMSPRKDARIFGWKKLKQSGRNYSRQRRRIAQKLGNPRLDQITFHTFRHWKATTEYHRTHDILYVMRLLGHKSIRNTLRYTQLIDWKSEEFTCKAAQSLDECSKLIESGFEYVTEIAEIKLFRKRK